MTAQLSLREFFEQELGSSQDGREHLGSETDVSSQHLVSHLIEQTVHRAALEAAAHRRAPDQMENRASAEVSWKNCLMVAALTELRPVKLLARN